MTFGTYCSSKYIISELDITLHNNTALHHTASHSLQLAFNGELHITFAHMILHTEHDTAQSSLHTKLHTVHCTAHSQQSSHYRAFTVSLCLNHNMTFGTYCSSKYIISILCGLQWEHHMICGLQCELHVPKVMCKCPFIGSFGVDWS